MLMTLLRISGNIQVNCTQRKVIFNYTIISTEQFSKNKFQQYLQTLTFFNLFYYFISK